MWSRCRFTSWWQYQNTQTRAFKANIWKTWWESTQSWSCGALSRKSNSASCLLTTHSNRDEMKIMALLVTGELMTFPIKRWPILPPVCAQRGCLCCKRFCECVRVQSDGWTAWLLTLRLPLLMWEAMLCRSNLYSCRLVPCLTPKYTHTVTAPLTRAVILHQILLSLHTCFFPVFTSLHFIFFTSSLVSFLSSCTIFFKLMRMRSGWISITQCNCPLRKARRDCLPPSISVSFNLPLCSVCNLHPGASSQEWW